MPPKKGTGKKGKKGKKAETSEENYEAPEPTEKENLLKKELDSLTEELVNIKKKVEELRKENEWLQQEAHQTRVESHEYMSYMSKKAHKRQTTIVTLSDQNQQEIRMINEQKEQMLQEYEERKKVLRDSLMEKETELAKTRKDLDELEEYKQLQEEQLRRIRDLEKEVLHMRGKHTETIQKLKSQFLKEKREYQGESEAKIQDVGKEANKEAVYCLQEHTTRIKDENRKLRQELLKLIQKSRVLNEHKTQLDDQHKELVREQQYAADLKRLHTTRQHKVFKAFDMLDDGET